ncbi:AAA family ATPase [Rhizobium leguminosarum]|uniref:AAA family ATPase n=1 Tax=Rhizobium ruizarguesonis TaxID=2081791 RepID=UPI001A99FFFC|nr:AAA family ATPase [Rhizobium ruizarguesonis]MBY5889091.1 AAA family ATPase [Rhizobium leguminosarum]QSZ03092.1 AAA family ATPase [Rhizobium ruizarguesonis]
MTTRPTETSSNHGSSTWERFSLLFAGAADHYGTYDEAVWNEQKGKFEIRASAQTMDAPVTLDLWRMHLSGEQPLGIVPVDGDQCRWFAIDVDRYDLDHGEIVKEIGRKKLPLLVAKSKSGGAHVYGFLQEPETAAEVRRKAKEIAAAIGHPDAEIFPKQDAVNRAAGDSGSWLNLPYHDAVNTTRYAVKENGLALDLNEFLALAERSAMSPDDFRALKVARRETAERTAAVPDMAEFGRMLDRWLRDIANAAPGDANNTLWHPIRDAGRWASVINIDEETTRQRFREAWLQRGKEDGEFDDVWRRNFEKGRRLGNPPREKEAVATPLIRLLADVPMEPIEWLWPGRFAVGKISMLAGHPGLGKSQLTMYMAAQVSRGRPWPFGEGKAPLGRVLVLSAEDDVADTLRPRFEVAGGNSSMVEVLDGVRTDKGERGLNLADDVRLLDRVLSYRDDYRLVIIDPISAYLGKTDTHTASEVRNVLAPIQKLAEQHRVAVVCVSHLVKAAGTAAINAVNGSGAFVAAARIACIVTKEMRDEEDEQGRTVKVETGRRIISIAKNNLGPDGSDRSLAYSVDSRNLGDGLEAPLIVWDEPVNMSADEAVGFREPGLPSKANDKAMRFLRRMLRDGPALSVDVEKAAEAEGISLSTLKRAKKELGAVSEKQADRWVMYIPGRQAELPL